MSWRDIVIALVALAVLGLAALIGSVVWSLGHTS